MGMINLIKDLLRSLYFLCSIQFLRMALLWTFSVAFSHYQLFKDSLFSHKIVSYPRSSPSTYPNKPVCVITGVSSVLFSSLSCKFHYYLLLCEFYHFFCVGNFWLGIIYCMQAFYGRICCRYW